MTEPRTVQQRLLLRAVMLTVAVVAGAVAVVEPDVALLLGTVAVVLALVHVPMLVFDLRVLRAGSVPPTPPDSHELTARVSACLGGGGSHVDALRLIRAETGWALPRAQHFLAHAVDGPRRDRNGHGT